MHSETKPQRENNRARQYIVANVMILTEVTWMQHWETCMERIKMNKKHLTHVIISKNLIRMPTL